jgi:hypothetical protein
MGGATSHRFSRMRSAPESLALQIDLLLVCRSCVHSPFSVARIARRRSGCPCVPGSCRGKSRRNYVCGRRSARQYRAPGHRRVVARRRSRSLVGGRADDPRVVTYKRVALQMHWWLRALVDDFIWRVYRWLNRHVQPKCCRDERSDDSCRRARAVHRFRRTGARLAVLDAVAPQRPKYWRDDEIEITAERLVR